MKIRITDDCVWVSVATKDGWLKLEWGGVFAMDYSAGKETHRGRVIDGGNIAPTLTATERLVRAEIIDTQYFTGRGGV